MAQRVTDLKPHFDKAILVIVGPTASGKSDLAVSLARKLGGEVISADSRQVYRGLDLGTGKITRKEMRGIPHHLLDVADPRRRFSAELYRKLGRRVIADIQARGKLPIIAGGSGFYIDALLDPVGLPAVGPDLALRAKLSQRSAAQLLAILKKLDPSRARAIAANPSDKNNPRRLIRAIEISTALKHKKKTSKAALTPKAVPAPAIQGRDHNISFMGIKIPREELRERIRARLLKRLKAGMLAEAKRLHQNGLSWKRMDELGLEYRYMARHLQGQISRTEMVDALVIEIGRYAKRQMTWFRRNGDIQWLDIKSLR